MKWKFPIAAVLILAFTLSCPGVAGNNSLPDPSGEPPVNAALSENLTGSGPQVAYREPEPLVPLLRLESNQTTFPGPRSMAFGPRRIEFSASMRGLVIAATIACIAVLAFVLYRRRTGGRKKDTL